MFDIQHDSPVPIHEQILSQIMVHVAAGGLKAGARLREYREFAQELVANPQAVARAYADLEWAGVIKKNDMGRLEVTHGAVFICKTRLKEMARQSIRQAVAKGLTFGLEEAEIHQAVDQELAAARVAPVTPDEARRSIKKPTHETSHRDSPGIQVVPPQESPGPAEPDRSQGGHIRPARG